MNRLSNGPSEGIKMLTTLGYFALWIGTIILAAKYSGVKTALFAEFILPVPMFFLSSTFRWYARSQYLSLGSGYSLGQDALGTIKQFELPDGTTTTGTVVRCSMAWQWYIVRTEDGKHYFIELAWKQPVRHMRRIALEEIQIT